MASCGEGILGSQTRTDCVWGPSPLLFRNEGLWPSDRGQDARDTQGRDALATLETIPKAGGLEAATQFPYGVANFIACVLRRMLDCVHLCSFMFL